MKYECSVLGDRLLFVISSWEEPHLYMNGVYKKQKGCCVFSGFNLSEFQVYALFRPNEDQHESEFNLCCTLRTCHAMFINTVKSKL